MLELNNYYIQEIENLTDLFTIIYTIIDDVYKDIIPISVRNRFKFHALTTVDGFLTDYVITPAKIDDRKQFFSINRAI